MKNMKKNPPKMGRERERERERDHLMCVGKLCIKREREL